VTCTLTAAMTQHCLLNTIIVIIIEFWDFSWSLLYYTLVSALVLGIGIAKGQYYWVLDIGCLFGIVLTLVSGWAEKCISKFRFSWQQHSMQQNVLGLFCLCMLYYILPFRSFASTCICRLGSAV